SASGQCASFPYRVTYNTLHNASYTGYNFVTSDVTDLNGLPGMCKSNPPSIFYYHQMAKIDGIYYDASYGYKYNSLTDIKNNAFSGWGIGGFSVGGYN